MNVPLLIAGRYLFARKSHNVINVISAISAIGMAIGTAALILIISVYNGFDSIIKSNISDIDPDVLAVSADGSRHFCADSSLISRLERDPRVASVCEVLEDNVFLYYGQNEGIARAKGVADSFSGRLEDHVVEGSFALHFGEIPQAALGYSLAYGMGIHPRFLDYVRLYYPDRDGRISPSNPAASLHSVRVKPSCLFSVSTDTDSELIILPLETMRDLMGSRDREVSGIEIRLRDCSTAAVRAFVRDCPEGLVMMDRYEQHPELFKMMKYEKLAVWIILVFVVIIVAFNIFGSLSMLIIEKKEDIGTLKTLGATDLTVRKIFVLEGWLISLLGLVAGMVAGVGLALLQQSFGLVKMPGGFQMSAYPVVLQGWDVLFTVIGVAVIGLIISLLAGKNIE